VNADAEGLIPREELARLAPNAPAAKGGAGGAAANSAVVLEIRALLQNASKKPQ
jgi:hypothetical protein